MADRNTWLVREAEVRAKINSLFAQNPGARFTTKAIAEAANCTSVMAKKVLRGMVTNGDAWVAGRWWSRPEAITASRHELARIDMNSNEFQLTCSAQFILYNESLLLYAQGAAEADVWHYLLCAVAYHDGIFPMFWNPEEDV